MMMRDNIPKFFVVGCLGVIGCWLFSAAEVAAQDAVDRLLQRVEKIPGHLSTNESCQVPSLIRGPSPVEPTGYRAPVDVAQQLGDEPPINDPDFSGRETMQLDARPFLPQPLDCNLNDKKSPPAWAFPKGEFLFDGDDAGRRVTVDKTWNVYGLDIEDTVAHFDTLDGRRLVSPSNRVAIYAPRFSAVRKVSDLGQSYAATSPHQFEDDRQTVSARGADLTDATEQFEQLGRHQAANHPAGFIDQTRGVLAEITTHLFGVRNSFSPFENLQLIRFGRFSSAESARLNVGMQSAKVWEDDLGLQVVVANVQPIIAKNAKQVQEVEAIKSEENNNILRVVKIASTIAARPGDIVEFTIRFDNISSKKIGNVTLIDNLTSRLEYVANSAESTHHADFITKPNSAGSSKLRWEIRDPIPPGEGGIVRFKCRVR
jgi:uncharacterized repeat protein (TIGR01451 family)